MKMEKMNNEFTKVKKELTSKLEGRIFKWIIRVGEKGIKIKIIIVHRD